MATELSKNPDWQTIVYQLALKGATNRDLAEAFDVSIKTIEFWNRTNPEFRMAVRRGGMLALGQVAESLFRCALGYEYEEDQVITYKGVNVDVVRVKKYAKPNAWAAYKILSLKDREHWHDTATVDITNRNINANITIDYSDISTEELALMKRIALNVHNTADDAPLNSGD